MPPKYATAPNMPWSVNVFPHFFLHFSSFFLNYYSYPPLLFTTNTTLLASYSYVSRLKSMRGLKQVRHSLISRSLHSLYLDFIDCCINYFCFSCSGAINRYLIWFDVNAGNPASYRYMWLKWPQNWQKQCRKVQEIQLQHLAKNRKTALRELSLQSSIT